MTQYDTSPNGTARRCMECVSKALCGPPRPCGHVPPAQAERKRAARRGPEGFYAG